MNESLASACPPNSPAVRDAIGSAADASLAARVAQGEEQAFGQFYDEFGRAIFSVISEILQDERQTLDVCDEAFGRMRRQAGSYSPEGGSLFTWAVMISRQVALERISHKPSSAVTAGAEADPLHLALFGGLSAEQISQESGIPLAAVRKEICDRLRPQNSFDAPLIDSQMEDASLYVLGALPPGEATELERKMEVDPDLRAVVNQLDRRAAELALGTPLRPLPPQLRARVLGRVRQSKIRGYFRSSWAAWAVAAAFALSCAYLLGERGRLRHRIHHLVQRDSVADLQIFSTAAGGALQDSGSLIVAWEQRGQRGLLQARGLSPNESNQDYQLWISDGRHTPPINAGVFHLSASEPVRLLFQPGTPIKPQAFILTVEKKGGAPAPKGRQVLIAK